MQTKTNTFLLLILTAAVLYLIWQRPHHSHLLSSSRDSVYVVDTNTYTGNITNVYHQETIINPVPVNVDTAAILAAYFSENVYQREYLDTNIRMVLTDTVTQNRLKSLNIRYNLLRPDKIITVTNTVTARPALFRPVIGIGTDFKSVTPEIGLQIRDRVQIGFGLRADLETVRPNIRTSITLTPKHK